MSIGATAGTTIFVHENPERGHRTRLLLAWLVAFAIVLVIAGYGFNYYTLSAADRPFSPKHDARAPAAPSASSSACSASFSFS